MDALVTPAWLAEHLDEADLVVLDASYTSTIPGSAPRDPLAAYRAGHIQGARFLDLDTLVDRDAALPSTIPAAALVTERLRALGIAAHSRIVLYDDVQHHTSARAWWLLVAFGITRVALLDGGIARWRAEGRPLAAGDEAEPARGTVSALPDASRLRTLDQMRALVSDGGARIVDARSAARFTGEEADPRPGTAAGHIPGSANLPYTQLFASNGIWKRGAELETAFADAGVDWHRPLVTTCGSGVTAAVLAFGAHLLGHQASLYDGSWSEWGADPSTPKAIGPA
ncbi:sulfurtransferase [uncultured Sphingomonas sp.]|uniref:sulfurtransferase n=1 Tax=uncultured Sphingomonas sp. TaxID=158754 RepID=UPI0035CB4FB4